MPTTAIAICVCGDASLFVVSDDESIRAPFGSLDVDLCWCVLHASSQRCGEKVRLRVEPAGGRAVAGPVEKLPPASRPVTDS